MESYVKIWMICFVGYVFILLMCYNSPVAGIIDVIYVSFAYFIGVITVMMLEISRYIESKVKK